MGASATDGAGGIAYYLPVTHQIELVISISINSCSATENVNGIPTLNLDFDTVINASAVSVADLDHLYQLRGSWLGNLIGDGLTARISDLGLLEAVGFTAMPASNAVKELAGTVSGILTDELGIDVAGNTAAYQRDACRGLPMPTDTAEPQPVVTGTVVRQIGIDQSTPILVLPSDAFSEVSVDVRNLLDEQVFLIALDIPTVEEAAPPAAVNGIVYRRPLQIQLVFCKAPFAELSDNLEDTGCSVERLGDPEEPQIPAVVVSVSQVSVLLPGTEVVAPVSRGLFKVGRTEFVFNEQGFLQATTTEFQ